MQDLNWQNYLELNDYIKQQNFNKEYLTPVVLIQWQFYGINFKYHIDNDFVLMFIKFNHDRTNIKAEQWYVFASYYKSSLNLQSLKQIIREKLFELNGNDEINFIDLLPSTMNDWSLSSYLPIESKYISNYIYDLEKMSTLAGKKLQKKRNHLNWFLKQDYKVEIKDIRDVDLTSIINFSQYHIEKYSDEFRQHELDVYKKYLNDEMQKDQRYVGTVFYIDNKIVAYTFGFLNGDTFEVIIEKAERDIRGLYQYVIVSNIKFHNIKCLYMDREDDAGLDSLAKSKMSYYPELAVKRYNIFKAKDW